MTASQIYIIISLIVLAIIFIFLFFLRKTKKDKKLTPLAGLAFGFVLSGMVFGDDRLIGYSFMGIGIILAVIDMVIKLKKKNK